MKKIICLVAALCFASVPAAYANWLHGVVTEVDSEKNTIMLRRANAERNEALPKDLHIKILENAKLKNVSNLSDIQVGNEVKVDARNNKEQGYWDANYIELIDADGANVNRIHVTTDDDPSNPNLSPDASSTTEESTTTIRTERQM